MTTVKKAVKKAVAPKKATKKNLEVSEKTSEKVTKKAKSNVTLISFSVTAVIPTQQYGNIQPTITVSAPSIEEAKELVMPVIENLYQTYAEMPLNGKPVKFLSKITEVEKVVTSVPVAQTELAENAGVVTEEFDKEMNDASIAKAAELSQATPEYVPVNPEPFNKAAKKISLSFGQDALDAIADQIRESVKIDPNDKPKLFELVLKKGQELASK